MVDGLIVSLTVVASLVDFSLGDVVAQHVLYLVDSFDQPGLQMEQGQERARGGGGGGSSSK